MIIARLSRVLVSFVAITSGIGLLSAAEPPLTGRITKAGVYRLTAPGKKISERGSATGYVTEGGGGFQSATTNVWLAQGTAFGFDFRIDGAPSNRPVRLTHLITHPKMRKPDGTILEKQTFERDVTSSNGTISGSLWYTLREDFELVPGTWSLSVLQGTTVLVEKKFSVSPAATPATKGK